MGSGNRSKYREFCKAETGPHLFMNDWWLDATCGEENWDVALYETGGVIMGVLPYYKSKIFSLFTKLGQPVLTPKLGIYIKYPADLKDTSRVKYEKDVMNHLINGLPAFDYFLQRFDQNISNWLPFMWKKFEQTTHYTYIIADTSNTDTVFKNFDSKVRGHINKAEKLLNVVESTDVEKFYALNRLTFTRQNIEPPYSLDRFKKIDTACAQHKCRKIFMAVDNEGVAHAAIYVIWDNKTLYNIALCSHPDLRSTDGQSLVLWHAIRFASGLGLQFDFEGSIQERIERSFSAYGGKQVPYMLIHKENSFILRSYFALKYLFRK